MDDIKLPPLPPTRLRFEVSINSLGERLDYTAEDMRAYARAALAAAPAPAPLTDEQMRDALRQCPHDTVKALQMRWLYAKDFARAVERAHGIGTDARAQAQKGQSNG